MPRVSAVARSDCSCAAHELTLCPPPSVLQLASGSVFGNDQPIALRLLGSERSYEALEGVAMELEDSLYPLLREVGHNATRSPCGILLYRL